MTILFLIAYSKKCSQPLFYHFRSVIEHTNSKWMLNLLSIFNRMLINMLRTYLFLIFPVKSSFVFASKSVGIVRDYRASEFIQCNV